MPEGIMETGRADQPRQVVSQPRGGTPGFLEPERVPWSELGPEFIETWGHDDDGTMIGEHIEVTGQSGSGKSYVIATVLQQRAQRWNTAEVAIVTKAQDDSIPLLGWPVIDSVSGLKRYRQTVFWPKTTAQGEEREKYMEARIYELLTGIWHEDINSVLYFDEIGFIEALSNRMKKQIRMMWREGRSHKLSIIASKQRPIGVVRDQHSESRWKFVFPPADLGDMERFAELLGRPRDWQPVLEGLNRKKHEFVLSNNFLKLNYITWVDTELRPVASQAKQSEQKPAHIYGSPPAEGRAA